MATAYVAPASAAQDALLARLTFTADGLIPVVAVRAGTGEPLMLAWMNQESLRLTLTSGDLWYWSRSRQALWRKGETSGNRQRLVELLEDCDGDSLIAYVEQTGNACHLDRPSCFVPVDWQEDESKSV